MTDAEAEATMKRIRWVDTDGQAVCSHCGSLTVYECRRPSGAARWRCKDCNKDFSITSGTLFASHKMPLRGYLGAIAVFCNEVKGKSMLALSRDLGLSYKTASCSATRCASPCRKKWRAGQIGDDRPEAEVDGAYFGGYVKPANLKEDRVDRRLAKNQSGKRKVVVVIRERGGETLPGVFKTKGQPCHGSAAASSKAPCCTPMKHRSGTICTRVKRIDHQQAYSLDGACTNWAESYFSRLRRGEAGHHHHISGPYLLRFAQEAAWREDNRRVPNGEQVQRVAKLALGRKKSVDFTGYWQRHVKDERAE